ncbi:MAG: hypothetical protein ACLQLC_05225 [Candidatus Sulfotelmatobacter sp.]
MKRIIRQVVIALSTLLLASLAGAQSAPAPAQAQDQSSLGDYARKVRKDPVAKARPKVFDNDNLPTDEKLSVVGQKAPETAAVVDDRNKDKDAAAKTSDDDAKKQALMKEWQGKLSAQKDTIDLASRELDVLQREYQLRAAVMYADAGNRLRNAATWDKEDADYKQKIADKQKSVDDAKQKLSDLQEQARKAGVPAGMIE